MIKLRYSALMKESPMNRSMYWVLWVTAAFIITAGCSEKEAFHPQSQWPPLKESKTPAMQDSSLSGQQLFTQNCASCHGVHGEGNPVMLQGARIHFNDAKWQKGISDQEIALTIQHGKGIMPAFETTFTPKEIHALVRYVRTLGATAKPAQPK